ncbi:MAG: hypothetical protein AAF664_09645 [Planctomycetota bacterium]
MQLPFPSIRKAFKDVFEHLYVDEELSWGVVKNSVKPPSTANQVQGIRTAVLPKNRRKLIRELSEKLRRLDHVQISEHPGDRDSRSKALVRFSIPDPHDELARIRYRKDEFRIETSPEGSLWLALDARYRESIRCQVTEWVELEKFVQAVLAKYNRRHASTQRQNKIRGFKANAIIAAVKQLAEEEQFDFRYTTDTQKLKLWVILKKDSVLEIEVRFSKFEETLPKLRQTICSLRQLYEEGLKFKIGTQRLIPWGAVSSVPKETHDK